MPRLRLALTVALVVVGAAASACGADRTGGLREAPAAVVAAAPDRTVAAGPVRMMATGRATTVEATVDLATGRGEGRLSGPALPRREALVALDYRTAYQGGGAAVADAELARAAPLELLGPGVQPGNPLAVLDLLRAPSKVEPYGGVSLRGVATQRYSLEIDASRLTRSTPGLAVVDAEVWIDDQGRLRRVQLANDLRVRTTTTDGEGLFPVTIIDLISFGTTDGD